MMWGAAHRCAATTAGGCCVPICPSSGCRSTEVGVLVATLRRHVARLRRPVATVRRPVATLRRPVATLRRPVSTWRRPVATAALVCSTRGDRHRLRLEHAPRLVARAEGARSSSSALGFWWPTKVRWNYLLCACACARFAGNNGFSATCAVAATIIIRRESPAAAARPAGHSGVLTGTHTPRTLTDQIR